jgi:hypothetical protein
MPAINVARTDTFETQRQKINQIGDQIFNISQGGSDLATGNLKLGDGTRTAPSLAFTSDASLGVYKSNNSTLGYVASGKKLVDISSENFTTYKDFYVRKNILTAGGLSFLDYGSNYDPGTYTSVPLFGGTGSEAAATVVVTEYIGNITSPGVGYTPGSYSGIALSGGNGIDAVASFEVEGIGGDITNAGSGYQVGSYSNILLSGGSGTGARADINVSGTTTLSGSITNSGSSYTDGVYSGVPLVNIPTQTFIVSIVANPGTPPPNSIYTIDGVNNPSLNLNYGNTYRFDLSDSSLSGHPFAFRDSTGVALPSSFLVNTVGTPGTSGAFIDLIIFPESVETTIEYYCTIHDGMGNVINLTQGSVGQYGYQATADIEVVSGSVSTFNFGNIGNRYKIGDQLTALSVDLGGTGNGFVYTISNVTQSGTITAVNVTNNGSGYLKDDVLSIDVANSIFNSYGSNFLYTVTTDPLTVSEFNFTAKGTGYQTGDVLELPGPVTGVSADLPGRIDDVNTTLSTASTQITVSDTTGILQGMIVENGGADVGFLAQFTTVASVDSSTQITLSANPISDGAASLSFRTPSLTSFTVTDSTGIQSGFIVTVVSGDGQLLNASVLSVAGNLITLNTTPTFPGSSVLDFTPTYGIPATQFQYTIGNLGVIEEFTLTSFGSGYSENDLLTINASNLSQPTVYPVTVRPLKKISFLNTVSTSDFSIGDQIKLVDGEILSVPALTASTLIDIGSSYTNVSSSTSGNGVGATFDVVRDAQDGTPFVTVNSSGRFYSDGDTVTISGSLVGGSSPTDDIVFVLSSNDISSNTIAEIYDIFSSSGNIDFMFVDAASVYTTEEIVNVTTNPFTTYTIDTELDVDKFFIDIGSGPSLHPDITVYSGNNYIFDFSDGSNTGHTFSLSKYRDGVWGPSYIENVSSVADITSTTLTVADTTGILPGMSITVLAGSVGNLIAGTFVESVDSATTITISSLPLSNGNISLDFYGTEYTEGVTRSSTSLQILITDLTESSLYYYCANHEDMAGEDNLESTLTVNTNNPKIFGSGFSVRSSQISTTDLLSYQFSTEKFTTNDIECQDIDSDTGSIDSLTSVSISSNSLLTSTITGSAGVLNLSATTANLNGSFNIGNSAQVQISGLTGNITTSGILKTTNSLNINDRLLITNNDISSTSGNNILLSPAVGRVAKINTTSALTIPSGTTAQRPTSGVVENGSIRFNTETGQYEGYSAATGSWSSLGGVRDLDGNTYIAAEASVGANDNTLYFFNDGNNTVSVTPNYLQFVDVKKIKSVNTTAPAYTDYTTNTQVTLGQYLKYRNNIYEVTVAGQTGTSGNEPTHTTGAVTNGTAELTWYTTAIAPLTFEEVSEVRIDPLGFTDLVVNAELRFSTNVISTDLNDLIIQPNSGKKVSIDAETSLVIPVGDSNQRGVAEQGSIRYNTDISQYEGYDGSNWTSLGGVKDVDGNTYIIPETAPGANENILYFYNDGINTMRLSANALDFTNIDAITSQNNNLDIEAQTVTFNSLAATIDTSGTSTFISTTKDNLDLGLAVGLNVDPLLRLDINGDIYLNKAFGTGSFDGLKLFNSNLSIFELADLAISTDDIGLIKGGTNAGAAALYDPATQSGARVSVSVVNQTTGDKEMIEYQVIDKGSDIYHTEIGNLKTGANQVTSVFDFDANNNVRVTFTLDDNLTVGDVVNITVVKNIFKN